MSVRRGTRAWTGTAAALLAACMAFATAGCGGGDGDGDEAGTETPRPSADATGHQDHRPSERPAETPDRTPGDESSEVIGEAEGPDGIVLSIRSATRDDGGFVTVSGAVANNGDRTFNASRWRSSETDVKSRSSISGASLVDQRGKKRYLILRDTDGECLCTTGLANLRPGESRPVFAQFPSPPADVTRVDFQLPTMPSISIEIAG
ncbi:hypothetical protein [Streptomyces sp. XD-27]|uniref:hypothetical protein n=1 Tax=Streptomyces sp. XD-27 TaxID=3062779 RepID=UPI0026F43F17|nr:hypothetical protein [Streptomyces sp. XD-27]WKX72301.1 hypothetical protein Q3Y56_22505 [Streptomyces sp. XD-27]